MRGPILFLLLCNLKSQVISDDIGVELFNFNHGNYNYRKDLMKPSIPIKRSGKIVHGKLISWLVTKEPKAPFRNYTVFPITSALDSLVRSESALFNLAHKNELGRLLPEPLNIVRRKRSTTRRRRNHRRSKKKSSRKNALDRVDKEGLVKESRANTLSLRAKKRLKKHRKKHRQHKRSRAHKKRHRKQRKHKKQMRRTANINIPFISTRRESLKGLTLSRRRNKREATATEPPRRMIGSKIAKIEDFPYTVSLQRDDQHFCTGAILNQQLVITTANCVWREIDFSSMMVRAGSRHANSGGQVVGIRQVMKHPKWNLRQDNPDFDIALLLLSEKLDFSDSVHSVDLPNKNMMPAFSDAWITSWGSELPDGSLRDTNPTLQYYHAKIMPHDECNTATTRFGVKVTENFVCFYSSGKVAPCTRDTGAPAVSDGVIWGLASWGIRKKCGTERYPSMFTYTASPSNIYFLVNATLLLMSEERKNPFLDNAYDKEGRYTHPLYHQQKKYMQLT